MKKGVPTGTVNLPEVAVNEAAVTGRTRRSHNNDRPTSPFRVSRGTVRVC